ENPMEPYNDVQFLAWYRFTKGTVREQLGMLPVQTSTDCRGLRLTPMLQLLVTLRFYGAGTFQVVTGDLVNVSQPALIAKHLFRDLVHFPSAAQFNTVMLDFFALAKFPGVTGCIDCTHVRIKSPGGDDAEVFRNRKGVFSINVQAQIKTRNSVERAFGIWKRRFPCLEMRLEHKPRRAMQIIPACAALHNLACLRKDPQPPPPSAPPVVPRARRPRRRATRPVHLPPVDIVKDSLTCIQTQKRIIERSFK
ncbi:hypothetical protein HPB47_018746, partial [Ixodes persulcatus]